MDDARRVPVHHDCLFGWLAVVRDGPDCHLRTHHPARYVNIPNKDYWLAPERRAQTLEFLGAHGMWLGCAMALFSVGVHWITMRANASSPPRLDGRLMYVVIAAFIVALAAWIAVLHRRFRKPA